MAYRNTDLLGHWRAQAAISEGQYQAGRRFVRLFEDAAFSGHASLDLTRPRVDGRPTPGGDRSVLARTELLALKALLGQVDFALLCRVLGQGRELAEEPDDTHRRYLARRIRDALAEVAGSAVLTY